MIDMNTPNRIVPISPVRIIRTCPVLSSFSPHTVLLAHYSLPPQKIRATMRSLI